MGGCKPAQDPRAQLFYHIEAFSFARPANIVCKSAKLRDRKFRIDRPRRAQTFATSPHKLDCLRYHDSIGSAVRALRGGRRQLFRDAFPGQTFGVGPQTRRAPAKVDAAALYGVLVLA